ncbi:gfo/Idh/MocA family oxidoreductase, partial [Rathayibacter caricis]|nr:gfo/Idh/MocA family oxidoreductase [Rathayibacter caricis]
TEIEQKGTVVGRGLGLLDMVRAIAEGRPHVATGELGFHVLDVMLSAQESAESGGFVAVDSTLSAPVPAVPVEFDPFAGTI